MRLHTCIAASLALFASSAFAEPSGYNQAMNATWKVAEYVGYVVSRTPDGKQHYTPTLAATGSGVMVDTDRIVTDCHVVSRGGNVNVTSAVTGKTYAVSKEAYDPDSDLCLLVAPGAGSAAVSLGDDDTEPGTPVFTISFPRGQLSRSQGKVVRTFQVNGWPAILTSAGCEPGSSGGGLYDDDGNLLGITAFITSRSNACNAIPIERVRMLMMRTPIRIQPISESDFFWQTQH